MLRLRYPIRSSGRQGLWPPPAGEEAFLTGGAGTWYDVEKEPKRNGRTSLAEFRTMAKKKAESSKDTGKDRPNQGVILVYKADAQTATVLKEWLAGLADHVGAHGHGHGRYGAQSLRRVQRLQADA